MVLDYVRRTSVIVYFLTFMFIYTTSHVEMAMSEYYLLLAMAMITIGLWVEMGSRGEVEVFPRSSMRLSEMPAQLLGGFLFAMLFVVAALGIGTISMKSEMTLATFFGDLVPQTIVVGGTETLFLIIYVRILFLGGYLYPVVFAFSHTRVAVLWTQGLFPMDSIVFFIYAAAQGVIFLGIYSGRVLLPAPVNKLFGPVAVAVYHGFVNTIAEHSYASGGV